MKLCAWCEKPATHKLTLPGGDYDACRGDYISYHAGWIRLDLQIDRAVEEVFGKEITASLNKDLGEPRVEEPPE